MRDTALLVTLPLYPERHAVVETSELWCCYTLTRIANGHVALSIVQAVGRLASEVPSDRTGM
jgi:hypothetical protein